MLTTDVIVEGLPQEPSFETVEYDEDEYGNQSSEVKSRHFWTWQTVDLTNHRISSKFFHDYADDLSNDPNLYRSESSFTHNAGTPLSRNNTGVGPGAAGAPAAAGCAAGSIASGNEDSGSSDAGFGGTDLASEAAATPRSDGAAPEGAAALEAAGAPSAGEGGQPQQSLSPLGMINCAGDAFGAGRHGDERASIASRSQASATSRGSDADAGSDLADGGDLESLRGRDDELDGMLEDERRDGDGGPRGPGPEPGAPAAQPDHETARPTTVVSEAEGLNAVVSMSKDASSESLIGEAEGPAS